MATVSEIFDMTVPELSAEITSMFLLFEYSPQEYATVKDAVLLRAAMLGVGDEVGRQIKLKEKEYKSLIKEQNKQVLASQDSMLEYASDHTLKTTQSNYLYLIMQDYGDQIQYNELTRKAERKLKDGSVRNWVDTDDYEVMGAIERKYKIYSKDKCLQALARINTLSQYRYHPIKELIELTEWDGVERCKHFLSKWAKADDDEYTREVSRLIFAGGINRLYHPGCKFEDVPVLIGEQGGGKSTLVQWLNINRDFWADLDTMENERAIEKMSGKWIMELGELLSLTRVREQEEVKAFISREVDRMRRPYQRHIEEFPRSCIFIGTTNNPTFLSDTANRRFYPVHVKLTRADGYRLHDVEEEAKEYIIQCWSEARAKLDTEEMRPCANRELVSIYTDKQETATLDDWRPGAIGKYLDTLPSGYRLCAKDIWDNAIQHDKDHPREMQKRDSREISAIMARYFPQWVKMGSVIKTLDYGMQRCWSLGEGEIEDDLF